MSTTETATVPAGAWITFLVSPSPSSNIDSREKLANVAPDYVSIAVMRNTSSNRNIYEYWEGPEETPVRVLGEEIWLGNDGRTPRQLRERLKEYIGFESHLSGGLANSLPFDGAHTFPRRLVANNEGQSFEDGNFTVGNVSIPAGDLRRHYLRKETLAPEGTLKTEYPCTWIATWDHDSRRKSGKFIIVAANLTGESKPPKLALYPFVRSYLEISGSEGSERSSAMGGVKRSQLVHAALAAFSVVALMR